MNRRFGVERIENRFDQDNISAAVNQTACRFRIGFAQFIISDIAHTRIIHIRRNRAGAIGRPQGTRHITWARRVCRFHRIAGLARQLGAFQIQLIGQMLHVIIGLRNGGGRKCIGLNNITARREIGRVNVANNIRLGQRQQIIISRNISVIIGETITAIGRFIQLMTLNHCAHCTVKHKNSVSRQPVQFCNACVACPTHNIPQYAAAPSFKIRHTANVKSAWLSV